MSRQMQNTSQAGSLFFEPPSRLQQADKLSHLVRYSDFVLLVLGEAGSGKSRLLQEITPRDQQDSTLQVCSVAPEQPMDVPELMSLLLKQLPNHTRYSNDQAGQLKALYEQVSAMRALGQRLLLLIDDADHLSDAALELLFNFMAAGGSDSKGAQAVLLGKPAFEQRLREARLLEQGEGRIHRTLLEPYSAEEAQEFLRLRYPTLQNQPKKKLDELLQQAAGMPGALENGALVLLRSGEVATRGSARAFPFPLPHLAGIVFVLIAITGVATWQFMPGTEEAALVDSIDRVEIELNLPAAPAATDASVVNEEGGQARQALAERLREQEQKIEAALRRVQSESSDSAAGTVAAVASSVPKVVNTVVAEEKAQPLLTADKPLELALPKLRDADPGDKLAASVAASVANNQASISPLPLKTVQPVVPKVATAAPVVAKPVTKQDQPEQAQPLKPVPKQVAKVSVVEKSQSQKKTLNSAAPAQRSEKGNSRSESKQIVAKQTVAPVAKQQRVANKLSDANQILQWSASEYTLQMLGARDRATVNKFLRQQRQPERFHQFSTIYKGQPWYVVVYGRYPSRKAAVAATANLPRNLQRLRPWARSVQGVQTDIRKK